MPRLVLAVGLVAAAALLTRRSPGLAGGPRRRRAAERDRRHSPRGHRSGARATTTTTEDGKSAERRADLLRLEERAAGPRGGGREPALPSSSDRERLLAERTAELDEARERYVRELERVAGMPASQARSTLLKELEDQVRHDRAKVVRQIEEETKRDADRRVRNILSVGMQRLAAGHAAETTVSVVQLSADDMKGRIIGREGRNIRALEHLTGVDFIIDDTPNAVILSGFDGVRREIARMTLEKLLQDGRIHPARIEETYYQAKSELEAHIAEAASRRASTPTSRASTPSSTMHARPPQVPHLLRPERARPLGRVRSPRRDDGRRAGRFAQDRAPRRAAARHRQGRQRTRSRARTRSSAAISPAGTASSEAVAHAMEAHHNEVEPQTVEAVLVQAADALSGARPGARGESLEQYVKRLRDLEQIATRHDGVDKVYAMQAGREIRVMVAPDALDDDGATCSPTRSRARSRRSSSTRGRSRSP